MPDPEVLYEASRLWLKWATADAKAAELLDPCDGFENIVAFHAQQAIEKALKAICLYLQTPFVKTHDLGVLLDLIAPEAGEFAASWRRVASLTRYCFAGRYPSSGPPITAADAEHARVLAREFLTAADEWVEARYSTDTQS